MRAYVVPQLDAPPELCEVPIPSPLPGEVLIRVLSSSVNPVDDLVAKGFFRATQEYRYPAVFGRDICGIVHEVGADVRNFAVGDTVWGFIKRDYIGDGTFAEFVACDASRFIVPKPSALSQLEAGSMGLAAVTALECLDVLRLSAGDSVFINRASGGVGSFAVQIAAARGLRVIATGRRDAAEYLNALGADEIIDWSSGSLASSVRSVAPEGVAGVVDLVRRGTSGQMGADEATTQAAVSEFMGQVLSPDGRFSTVTNGASKDSIDRGTGFNIHSEPTRANLEALNSMVEQGRLRGCVTAAFAFADIDGAFEHQRAHGRGKTAVVIDKELWASTREPMESVSYRDGSRALLGAIWL